MLPVRSISPLHAPDQLPRAVQGISDRRCSGMSYCLIHSLIIHVLGKPLWFIHRPGSRLLSRAILPTQKRGVSYRECLRLLNVSPLQIARLYRPLDVDPYSDDEDDPFVGTALLPTHRTNLPQIPKPANTKTPRLDDVWDEQEEPFGIGDDEDEDHDSSTVLRPGPPPQTPVPKILITNSG